MLMRTPFRITILAILSLGLFSCSHDSSISWNIFSKEFFEVVALPHHNLTGKSIDEFYQSLQEKYHSFDQIILLSPDHYGFAKKSIESLPNTQKKICYQNSCVWASGISPYNQSGNQALFPLTWSTLEHGIGEHISRIATFFPHATTIPIILRRKLVPGEEEAILADTIANIRDRRILVIASVDFSHHVREDFAILHDAKSIDTLSYGNIADFSTLEVDCRNCLAVSMMVAEKKWKPFFHFQKRTSVDTLTLTHSDTENTSHIFWRFSEESTQEQFLGSWVFLFAGDTHWARGFAHYTKKYDDYQDEVLKIFYQKYNPENNPKTKYHRVFSGFDDVIVNWESGIGNEKTCQKSGKTTQMWTHPNILSLFHTLGITLANIANNHSHDCGNNAFLESKHLFQSWWIDTFWYDDILVRKIRENTFAFIGIDFIEKKPDEEWIKNKIISMTASWYLVIVNVHWGTEYEKKHDTRQEKIAHMFIDAGARLVIGHHPHVVQDSEVYKGIPIYYSLGNFLFDQPFPETLRGILVWCQISSIATSCTKTDIYRNPKNYTLHF